MEDARDNEAEILDEMIENLDLYLKALDWSYNTYNRMREEQLLKQLLNVNTEEEIRQQIMQDIDEFNSYCDGSYKTYIGIFSNFLDEYRINLEELAALQQMQKSILNAADFLSGNNVSFGVGTGGGSGSTGGRTYQGSYATLPNGITTPVTIVGGKTQQTDLPVGTIIHTENGGDWQITGGTGTTGDPYTSKYLGTNSNSVSNRYSGSYVNGYGSSSGGSNSYKGSYNSNIHNRIDSANNTLLSGGKFGNVYLKGYAGGLDEGPVTTTGPAMLHGTASNPEYVLTSDQATNVVDNANEVTQGLSDLASDEVNVDAGEQYEGGEIENGGEGIIGGDNDGTGNATGGIDGAETGEGTTGGNGTGTATGDLSKVISLLSQLVTLQGTNNTQVSQIIGLCNTISGVMSSIYAFEQTDSQQDYEIYTQMLEIIGIINDFLNANIPTILSNQTTANTTLSSILSMTTSGVDQLTNLVSILSGGMSGQYHGAKDSGSWVGTFTGGGITGEGGSGTGGGMRGGGGTGSGGSSNYENYAEIPGVGTIPVSIVNGKTQQTGLPVGTIIHTSSGQSWKITGGSGEPGNAYTSELISGGSSSSSSGGRGNNSSSGNSSGNFHDKVSSINDTLSSGGKVGNVYLKGYSEGIENGPITYTGLAMLHGTPNEPEYVLNNDQMYNLLTNLVNKPTETEKVVTNEGGDVNYIVQGDVVLEGVDNPAEFWNAVTKSISNRRNVTKNTRKL